MNFFKRKPFHNTVAAIVCSLRKTPQSRVFNDTKKKSLVKMILQPRAESSQNQHNPRKRSCDHASFFLE